MTKIKFCGMRRRKDILAANEIHPDYIGMICSDGFRRSVPQEKAAELKSLLDPEILSVGVFVDEPYEKIAAYLKKGIIDIVQLHGSESQYYIEKLREVMIFQDTLVPVIRAYQIRSEKDLEAARHSVADYVLLDSGRGTGRTFDWSVIHDIGRDFFLAGGLTPENAGSAVDAVHPFAIDMSSGIETDGMKDPDKMRRAAEEVRKR